MSLGGTEAPTALKRICDLAWKRGLLLVAAAGNVGPDPDTVTFPAKYESVIAVSALAFSLAIAAFSSRGPEVELCAPGVSVLSTLPGGACGYMSGTSMACPHVSGVAALAWGTHRYATDVAVRRLLAHTSDNLGIPGRDANYGFGRADAEQAAFELTKPPAVPGLPVGALTLHRPPVTASESVDLAVVLDGSDLIQSGERFDVAGADGAGHRRDALERPVDLQSSCLHCRRVGAGPDRDDDRYGVVGAVERHRRQALRQARLNLRHRPTTLLVAPQLFQELRVHPPFRGPLAQILVLDLSQRRQILPEAVGEQVEVVRGRGLSLLCFFFVLPYVHAGLGAIHGDTNKVAPLGLSDGKHGTGNSIPVIESRPHQRTIVIGANAQETGQPRVLVGARNGVEGVGLSAVALGQEPAVLDRDLYAQFPFRIHEFLLGGGRARA